MHYLTLVPPSDTAAITKAQAVGRVGVQRATRVCWQTSNRTRRTGYVATVTFAHSGEQHHYATITNTAGAACVITKSEAFTNSVPDGLSNRLATAQEIRPRRCCADRRDERRQRVDRVPDEVTTPCPSPGHAPGRGAF